MKFLGDENLDWQIVEQDIPDDEVLNLANNQRAILLTSDKDFGELFFRLRRIATSVVLIRLFDLSPNDRAVIVANAINQHADKLLEAFIVISSKSIHIPRMT